MLTRRQIEVAVKAWAPMIGLSDSPLWTPDGVKNDSGETGLLIRALEDISTKLHNQRYPKLQGRSILPIKTDINPAAEFHTYAGMDFTGTVDETEDYSDDNPGGGEVVERMASQRIIGIRGGYGFSIMDVRRGNMAGTSIDTIKALKSREAMEQKFDLVLSIGSKNRALNGVYGFWNQPNYSTALDVTGMNTGAYASTGKFASSDGTKWDFSAAHGKGPNQIVADFNAAYNAVRQNSLYIYDPDTVCVGPEVDDLFAQTNVNIGDTATYNFVSVKSYIMSTCTWIKKWKVWNQASTANGTLATAGTPSGTPLVMVYEDNPDNYEALLPQDFEQFPPQLRGMMFGVGTHMRTGGVLCRAPKAFQLIKKPFGT